MRRKQLFALALAGMMSMSLAPSGLYAEDMAGTEVQAVGSDTQEEVQQTTEEQPVAETASEPAAQPAAEPAVEPAAEPAQQTAAEPASEPAAEPAAQPAAEPATQPAAEPSAQPAAEPAAQPTTEPAAQPAAEPTAEPTAEPAAEPVYVPTTAPEEVPGDQGGELVVESEPTVAPTEEARPTDTPAPTETPTPTPEEKKTNRVTNESELAAAIEAAETNGPTFVIDIANDIELTHTVNIPAGKKICLVTTASEAEISRSEGFTGDMFSVRGTLSFLTANLVSKDEIVSGDLSIDGSLIDGKASGSIIHVYNEGGNAGIFAMDDSAELTGNETTGKGGAVYNEGYVLLLGGTISGNTAEEGGAIYSTNLVSIEKSADVTGNYKTGTITDNNIAFAEQGYLVVDGAISIGRAKIHAVEPSAGKVLVRLSDEAAAETTLAEALTAIKLDDDSKFKLDGTGSLVSTAPAAPTATPSPAVTPQLKRVSGPVWEDENTASVTCLSDMDGWYYAAVALEDDEIPTFDVNEEGTPIKADEEFTATVEVPEEDGDYFIYILIRGENNTLSIKGKAPLDKDTRPGRETTTEETTTTTEETTTTTEETTTTTPEETTTTTEETTTTTTEEVTTDESGSEESEDIPSVGAEHYEVSKRVGESVTYKYVVTNQVYDKFTCDVDSVVAVLTNIESKTEKYKIGFQYLDRLIVTHYVTLLFNEEYSGDINVYDDKNNLAFSVTANIIDDHYSVSGLEEDLKLKKDDEVKFSIIGKGTDNNDPKEDDVKWVVADVPDIDCDDISVTESDNEGEYILKANTDTFDSGKYTLTFPLQKYVYNGSKWVLDDSAAIEEAEYSVNISPVKSREPVKVNYADTVINGITGYVFHLVANEEKGYYKKYDFNVVGAGGDNTDPIDGDTRYIPLTYTLTANGTPVDLKLRTSSSAPTTADGVLYSEKTLRDGKSLQLKIELKEQIYADGKWVDVKENGKTVTKTLTKGSYVRTVKLPVATKKYSLISGKTGVIKDYVDVTAFPADELKLEVTDSSVATAEFIKDSDGENTQQIRVSSKKAGSTDVKVIWKVSNTEEYPITTFTINVKDIETVYVAEGESYTDTITVPDGATLECSTSDNKVATAEAGKTSTVGNEKKSTITIKTNELERNSAGKVTGNNTCTITVKDSKTGKTLKEYYVKLHQKQTLTLKEGQSTSEISFTSETEPEISLTSDDEKIAKGTFTVTPDYTFTNSSGNTVNGYKITFKIEGISAGGPVKVTLSNKGIPQRTYLVTVTGTETTTTTTTTTTTEGTTTTTTEGATTTTTSSHIAEDPGVSAGRVVINGTTVANNGSITLDLGAGNFYDINVTGAGMGNTSPGLGDVRYNPAYWVQVKEDGSLGKRQTSWRVGSSTGIASGKSIPIRVYYTKQRWDGSKWVDVDTNSYTSHTIMSGSGSGTNGSNTNGSGSGTGSGSSSSRTSGSSATGSSASSRTPTVTGAATGSTQVGNARTGDSAPISTMMLLGAMSLLTGGYVIVRKRKRGI